jgi:glutathione S-transferase
MDMYTLPSLVTALATLLMLIITKKVGGARGRYKVPPPATHGHPDFERYYRVHMNTLEQLVMFLPSLWLFAIYVSPEWAAGLGAVWIVGRILFARGYYIATEKRILGFVITISATAILLLGGIVGIVLRLLEVGPAA